MSLLEWMQSTPFADWVLTSVWGYPILLTLHSIGLALLVGILIVIDLRIIGVARAVPIAPFRSLMRVVWIGFGVNLVSGVAIFFSDAVKYFHSTTFRVKLLCIVLGLILAALISVSVIDGAHAPGGDTPNLPVRAKVLAALSLLVWLGAITAGRLMAYLD